MTMGVRILLAAAILPLAAGFATHRVALVKPVRSSRVILFEIDEKAVSDAVSIDQTSKETNFPPPPPPKPVELPRVSVTAPPVSVAPPTWSPAAPASSTGGGDLPLAAIAGGLFAAFAAGTFLMRGRGDEAASAPAPSPVATAPAPAASAPVASASPVASSSDVSIPYDAAARLAFDEWRAAHKKGDYVEAKFQKFKISYDAVTSANMAAKKQARDTGTSPVLKSLLASADE